MGTHDAHRGGNEMQIKLDHIPAIAEQSEIDITG